MSQAHTVADADSRRGGITPLSLGTVIVVTELTCVAMISKNFKIQLLLLPVFVFLWDDLKPVGTVSYLDSGAEEKLFQMELVHLLSSASERSC